MTKKIFKNLNKCFLLWILFLVIGGIIISSRQAEYKILLKEKQENLRKVSTYDELTRMPLYEAVKNSPVIIGHYTYLFFKVMTGNKRYVLCLLPESLNVIFPVKRLKFKNHESYDIGYSFLLNVLLDTNYFLIIPQEKIKTIKKYSPLTISFQKYLNYEEKFSKLTFEQIINNYFTFKPQEQVFYFKENAHKSGEENFNLSLMAYLFFKYKIVFERDGCWNGKVYFSTEMNNHIDWKLLQKHKYPLQ